MLLINTRSNTIAAPPFAWSVNAASEQVTARRLANEDISEVLAFLAERPLHNVIMAGMIYDNGLDSKLNRGTFYACRSRRGALEGVALIGHATLLDARTDRALRAFARRAQDCGNTHMIMGEQDRIADFWRHYANDSQTMRFACRELLFELTSVEDSSQCVPGLRLATLDDLDLVAPVQAELAFAESGVNPLGIDPQGFRARCARRIAQGRTWLLTENDRLIFKAEVQSETPEVIYLEGIYIDPELRGQSYGHRCLTQLCGILLIKSDSICLLVNEQNELAHQFYQKAGFELRDYYDTIFLRRRDC
ncbi:MAG: GNAT family N-acetyltransferase [Acidobacteriota bacterium]|nr:GNAT family N-acetyltransferase [Acidobacteriota bacterium]